MREGYATPQEALEVFAREGAKRRYPDGVPAHVEKAIAHELKLVEELDYAPYFLTVHDIVRFRPRRRTFSARGAARRPIRRFAIASASPRSIRPRIDLLFERFISAERNEPPDIDVDFEHERREEVMQYIYRAIRPRARRPDRDA